MKIPEAYIVKSIKKSEAYPWILNRHYAHRIPSISYAMGLFDNQELIGICTFGKPASPSLCDGICGKEFSKNVIELNRLCVNELTPKNSTSFLVSHSLKLLPSGMIIVSYADTSMNHIGYIYQACNFIYTGLSEKRTDYINPNSEDKHCRHNKGRSWDSESIRVERARKHRYVYFIGNKTWKKKALKNLKYSILPYPKGDNKRYDASGYVEKQRHLF